jgi:hypothetical protein
VNEALAVIVVIAFKSSWFRVTDTELLIGVFSPTSALPQYLMQAMFVGALCVVEMTGYSIFSVSIASLINETMMTCRKSSNHEELPALGEHPYS